jgi:hypothetical protein
MWLLCQAAKINKMMVAEWEFRAHGESQDVKGTTKTKTSGLDILQQAHRMPVICRI